LLFNLRVSVRQTHGSSLIRKIGKEGLAAVSPLSSLVRIPAILVRGSIRTMGCRRRRSRATKLFASSITSPPPSHSSRGILLGFRPLNYGCHATTFTMPVPPGRNFYVVTSVRDTGSGGSRHQQTATSCLSCTSTE